MTKKADFVELDGSKYLRRLDCNRIARSVGELWYDPSGNECYFRADGSISCRTVNNELSLTIQAEKDSCDLNYIIARYGLTEKPVKHIAAELSCTPFVRKEQGQYGDFSSLVDYHEAVRQVQKIDDLFLELPAAVRARFSNDPGELLSFIDNPDNRLEAIKLGLVAAPQDSQVPQGAASAPSKEGEVKTPASNST